MKVAVRYLGFQPIEDLRRTTVEMEEGSQLQDLIKGIREDRPFTEQELIDRATLLVNEEKGDPEMPLKDGDRVLILVPLGGG